MCNNDANKIVKTTENKDTNTVTANKPKAYDMFRNRIQAGDYINYPCRSKSDLYMRTAKVIEINTRQFPGEKAETILKVALAKAPRYFERADGNWDTKIVKTTISVPHRTTIVPKSYIQNDKRYSCLLDL